MSKKTVLMYGRTGAGKTAQIGQLAEYVYHKYGKKTRLATADRGGTGTIQPYINLGIIEVVEQLSTDIWIWVNKVTKGMIRDDQGKWILDKAKNANIGLYAFESTHGIAQLMKADMQAKAAIGVNIGGDTNTSFDVSDVGSGERLKIGSTKGYQQFSIPQGRVYDEILQSQALDAEFILWTAGITKDDDEVSTSRVIGPDVIGKALTGVVPKDFNYTFRIDVLPAKDGKAERHILYLGSNMDMSTAGASALGNTRMPLDAPPLASSQIEPASITKALELIEKGGQAAEIEIKKRLAAKVS